MENLFSTTGVEEVVASGGNQKYIYGGVYNDVKISNVSSGATPTGTPYLRLTMHTAEGGDQAARDFDFFFTEKAAPISMRKLKHIATKVVTEAEFETVKATNLSELVAGVAPLLKGRRLRMKFNGEEYRNAAGEVKEKATIGLPEFAEAIEPNAEYPVVADADTKLTYDKSNTYDFKKLPDAGPTDESAVNAALSGGLDDI